MDVGITAVTIGSRGGLGTYTCHGTAVAVLDAPPTPIEFAALTRKEWVTPFVSPVTEAVVSVEMPSANVDHVSVPSILNSMM
jgi:hypothetical protein